MRSQGGTVEHNKFSTEPQYSQTNASVCRQSLRLGIIKGHLSHKRLVILLIILTTTIGQGIYASRHSEGLNRWSFLSTEGHELYSDLLCPNPMVGGNENRVISSSSKNSTMIIRGDANVPVPNDIWALKTASEITFLPCDLRQPFLQQLGTPNQGQGQKEGRRSNGSRSGLGSGWAGHRILFMNLTFLPFDFEGTKAKLCKKFIKLQFDEDEGVELNCEGTAQSSGLNHIHWPTSKLKRKRAFSLFRNLERLLQNEESLRRKLFLQLYFTSATGPSKKCTVQQYELNLPSPGCNSRRPPKIDDVCGEFSCDDLIFPYFLGGQRVKFIWKSGTGDLAQKPTVMFPQGPEHKYGNQTRWSHFGSRRLDTRFVVFITVLPIVLFGMLVFSLEIIIYITCLRRSRSIGEPGRDARSQQILQNSLNLWESIPNRECRSVSFSPVTTNIDPEGSESPGPDALSTPRVLKSALKKSEHLPSPPASFFEMDRECPPTYVEAMQH